MRPIASSGPAAPALPAMVQDWLDLYMERFPRTRPNGRRALRALYDLLHDPPADGFTVRDVAALAGVGLDTVARVVHHLRRLGVLTVDGGGWVAEPGGRPGHGVRYRYATRWPPAPDGAVDPRPAPAGPRGESRYSGRRRIMAAG